MAEDRADLPGDASPHEDVPPTDLGDVADVADVAEITEVTEVTEVTSVTSVAEGAVVRAGDGPAVPWRRRALAVRDAVPQLARNPVGMGAGAAMATVALRIAVDAAARAVTGSAGSRSQAVEVSGTIRHELHVIHHHVVHHYYPYPSRPYPPR